ncbi:hypothetical protein [Sphaerotilus microaerophilus]|uniref:Uncharacterized protein n=1 Tax=Sphaerotilus microaerophilus TaxID=2914710 RepID=A0ABM7YLV9_9BURK|nr:hypothetical protein [Sphaerotilus sp. FB-5]BDI05379.1 hypothetical protein CATMQ487_23490 [Sphaerotilus sp. FB-5]
MTDSLATRLTRQLGTRLIHRLRRFGVDEAAAGPGAAPPAQPASSARLAEAEPGTARAAATLRPALLRPAAARPIPVSAAVVRRNGRPPQGGARCTVDPCDGQRTLISGRMSDVCEALDLLIARQALQGRAPAAGLPAA